MSFTPVEKRVSDIFGGGPVLATDLALLQPHRPKPYTAEEVHRLDKARARQRKEHDDKLLAEKIACEIQSRLFELELVARYCPEK